MLRDDNTVGVIGRARRWVVRGAAGGLLAGSALVAIPLGVGPAAAAALVANPDSAEATHDQSLILHPLDNDTGSGALSLVSVGQPAVGTGSVSYDLATGTVTYSSSGYLGAAQFNYTMTDVTGVSTVGVVHVHVRPGANTLGTTNFLPLTSTVPGHTPQGWYVAATGTDSAATTGSSSNPFLTIGYAVSRAASGDTVLVHGSTTTSYHESVQIPALKSLTVENWPGTGPVWLDGTLPATLAWNNSRSAWTLSPFTAAPGAVAVDAHATITRHSLSGGTARLTTSTALGLAVGQSVSVAHTPADSVFDGTFPITAVTTTSPFTVSYKVTSTATVADSAAAGTAVKGNRSGDSIQVTSAFPYAGYADQVFASGTALQQVAPTGAVPSGAFAVDPSGAGTLLVGGTSGTPPASVRYSDPALGRAMSVYGDGSIVRGIGIWGYATPTSGGALAALVVQARRVTLEQLTVHDNAYQGISIVGLQADVTQGSGNTVRNVTVRNNGMVGLHANFADGLTVDGLLTEGNNTQNYDVGQAAAGVKVTTSRNLVLQNVDALGNQANGVWLDESVGNASVVRSIFEKNTRNGLQIELSGVAVVADNIFTSNYGNAYTGITSSLPIAEGGRGLVLLSSNAVVVSHNAFWDSYRPIAIFDDTRRHSGDFACTDSRKDNRTEGGVSRCNPTTHLNSVTPWWAPAPAAPVALTWVAQNNTVQDNVIDGSTSTPDPTPSVGLVQNGNYLIGCDIPGNSTESCTSDGTSSVTPLYNSAASDAIWVGAGTAGTGGRPSYVLAWRHLSGSTTAMDTTMTGSGQESGVTVSTAATQPYLVDPANWDFRSTAAVGTGRALDARTAGALGAGYTAGASFQRGLI